MMLLLSLLTSSFAAPNVPAVGPIHDVKVQGTRRIEEAAVLANIGMRSGEKLNDDKVARDIRNVWSTGFFDDVIVERRELEDGTVDVIFTVREKPAIRDVKLEGNKKLEEDDLAEVMDIRSFSVLNESKVSANLKQIRDLYVEKGYYLADVEVVREPVADDQVDLVFKITENRKVLVQSVDFNGNEKIATSKLRRFMQVKEGGFVPWLTSSGTFRRDQLDVDQQTLNAVYYEEGYVDIQIEPPNVYLSPDKRFIFVSYNIDEGEQYDFGTLDVSGDFKPEEGLTADHAREIIGGEPVHLIQERTWRDYKDKKRLIPKILDFEGRALAIAPGDSFKYSSVQAIADNIASLYRDQGYAFVNVVPLTQPDPASKTVNVTFDVSMGEKVRIGKINISGNDPTFDKVVRREIQINEGDLYRGSLLNASRARLSRLGFFEDISISTPRGDAPDVLDLNFQVSEQPTGSFSLGAGYSNLESFAVNGNISKQNFMGLGWSMSAAINWSRLRRQFNVSFVDPYFLNTRWSMSVSAYSVDRQFGQFQQQVPNGLNEFQRGGSIGVGRYLDQRDDIQLSALYTIEDVGLTNIDPFRERLIGGKLYQNGITSSVGLTLTVDKRNNRIQATQGLLFTLSTTLAGGFRVGPQSVFRPLGGEFNFLETKANLRVYQPLWKGNDRFVLRFNSSAGYIRSTDGEVIPFIHRYRAGGINSLRGYNWFSLGPSIRALSNDDPARADDRIIVGGNQTFVNNLEIEAQIIRSAGVAGVVFFDFGNAFGDPFGGDNLNFGKLRTAVGAGVRWRSPIGPLRFEYGIPLRPFPDERKAVFDFSIGSFF